MGSRARWGKSPFAGRVAATKSTGRAHDGDRSGRRGVVLVDHAAQDVAATDVRRRRAARLGRRLPLGSGQPERAVRPFSVVVRRIAAKDVLEMSSAEDEHVIETFGSDATNPMLRDRVRLRRPHRRFDHADALRSEDRVERSAELGVAVMGQVAPFPVRSSTARFRALCVPETPLRDSRPGLARANNRQSLDRAASASSVAHRASRPLTTFFGPRPRGGE